MKIDLLTLSQIQGKDKLEIFKNYGINAKVTDFVILLGRGKNIEYINEKNGSYITKTYVDFPECSEFLYSINCRGLLSHTSLYNYFSCIRPCIKYSNINPDLIYNKKRKNDILEIEYGEYPQIAVGEDLNNKLEALFLMNKLDETGKKYTTDDMFFPEYEFDNKKYIRVEGNFYNDRNRLLDGRLIFDTFYYWLEVKPITWLVDEKSDIAITKDLLVSHIFFNNRIAKFIHTKMYKYLNDIFLNEIQIKPKEIKIEVIKEKSKQEIELENIEKTKQKILALKNKIK